MARRKSLPRILLRPLPGAIGGLACKRTNTIELDPNIAGAKEFLRVTVHEALHLADWKASERRVDRISREITDVLWSQGYRISK